MFFFCPNIFTCLNSARTFKLRTALKSFFFLCFIQLFLIPVHFTSLCLIKRFFSMIKWMYNYHRKYEKQLYEFDCRCASLRIVCRIVFPSFPFTLNKFVREILHFPNVNYLSSSFYIDSRPALMRSLMRTNSK